MPVDGKHSDAKLKLTVVNEGKGRIDDGRIADRLVAVSSPIATAGRIVGDARIPDGQVLTAGYDQDWGGATANAAGSTSCARGAFVSR